MTRWPWLVLSLALVGAPGAFTAAAGPTDIPGVDEFIDAPRALFGRTRQETETRLGTPLQVEPRGSGSDAASRPAHSTVRAE
ncbi:MAG: hypothetical protein HY727_08065 [Candidatus Rokubacteria bacterium]|nr:hypothetical protein [Candidatus Rokubacteria bacterium]